MIHIHQPIQPPDPAPAPVRCPGCAKAEPAPPATRTEQLRGWLAANVGWMVVAAILLSHGGCR